MSSPIVEVQSEPSSSLNQQASVAGAQREAKYAFVESFGDLALGVTSLARAEAAAEDGSGPQQLATRIRSAQHEAIQPTQAACVPIRACFCKTSVFFD